MPPTHQVFNQPPPLTGYDVADDPAMLSALPRESAAWAEGAVRELGRLAGSAQVQEQGRQANENPPKLRTHDRFGHRVDEVEFHPAWHELMTVAVRHGLHAAAWRDTRPLMASVLADLAIESEATTMAAFQLAGATDRAVRGDEGEAAFRRLALAATKYWACKRAPAHAAEALECLGGGGYVEESGMPRLYREAPLASIWEGSGNVAALDALRALTRRPGSAEALIAELDQAAGRTAGWTRRFSGCGRNSPTRLKPGPATWPRPSRSSSRARCSSGTAIPRWPTCSWRPAWPRMQGPSRAGATRSARSRPASIPRPSSGAPRRRRGGVRRQPATLTSRN